MDGHGASPYEQNTQQSPGLGFSCAAHAGHSQKNWQASTGMRTRVAEPHSGQVTVLSSCNVRAASSTAHASAALLVGGIGTCLQGSVIVFQPCRIGVAPPWGAQRRAPGLTRSHTATTTMTASPV